MSDRKWLVQGRAPGAIAVRRVLVTGANKGIGLAIVRKLLSTHPEVHVLLGSRSQTKGEGAVAQLLMVEAQWAARVEVLVIDTARDGSVADAKVRVEKKYGAVPPPLYGIVNNAGIAIGSLNDILEVNCYGPRRVDEAFMPLLAQGGRIVYISSGAGPSFVSKVSDARRALFTSPNVSWTQLARLMEELIREPNFEAKGLGPGKGLMGGGYGFSKAVLNAYCVSVAREHPKFTVNACSPGLVNTDLITGVLGSGRFLCVAPLARCVLGQLAGKMMGAKSPDEATVAPLFLLMAAPAGSGWFFGSDALRSPLDAYRAPGSPAYKPT